MIGRTNSIKRWFAISIIVLMVATIIFVRLHLLHSKFERTEAASFIPSPVSLKMLSLGFEHVLADYYWLQLIQYVGDSPARNIDKYSNADQYLDLVITLDPTFIDAYYFAAFIIGKEQGRPNQAAELIERGIRANQDNWYLPFIAGVNQYLYAHKEVEAARYYRMAAKYPDAPKWLGRQAEILEAKIPSMIKEINVWDSLYTSARDDATRERARSRLIELWLNVYRTAPTVVIKTRAHEQLQRFGGI